METPIVSVVLPVYNDIYLKEAVESILGQTFTSFELIIIDDGSNEETKGVINNFVQTDSR
jgi:glycosyltransferase involved in cell wall biosynthesis